MGNEICPKSFSENNECTDFTMIVVEMEHAETPQELYMSM